MKEENKKIRELEWKLIKEIRWTTFFVFLMLIFIAFSMVDSIKINKLENQLQSCQDNVKVWTAKFYCEDETSRITMEYDFENKTIRDVFQKVILDTIDLNCEVIK